MNRGYGVGDGTIPVLRRALRFIEGLPLVSFLGLILGVEISVWPCLISVVARAFSTEDTVGIQLVILNFCNCPITF